jgi:hypothetical protein
MMKTPMIHSTEHEKNEWSRMAKDAYANDRNDIGHRFSGAATLNIGEACTAESFYSLQSQYRKWLIDGISAV